MSRIFISYRRTDSPAEAGRIYDYLEPHFGRESIFKDVDAIDAGDNFRDRIHQAVGQCQVLLAVIGKGWLQAKDLNGNRRLDNAADWVRLEIETALNRKVRVIPILLDGVEMPSIDDLPTALQPLAYINAARVRHDPDFRRDMERVLKVIGRDIAASLVDIGFEKCGIENYQGGIADFDSALRLNFDNPKAYVYRGLAKSALGDNQGGIADCDQALQLDPNYADAYFGRGLSKSVLGDNQGAIADYDQALRLNPDDADVYNNRGSAKDDLGDNQGAIADYDQALRLNPDYVDAYYSRGRAKHALGDKQGAIPDYQKAARLYQQQGNTEYYNHALNALKQLGGSLITSYRKT